MRIDATIDRPEGVSHQPLNLREDVPHKVYGQRGVVRVKVTLEVVDRHLVPVLVLPIII